MTQRRFDIAAVVGLQSKGGGLGTGAQIRNGFVEAQRNGELWSWQRPALETGAVAPLTGVGLGMYLVGTQLWGLYNISSTAASTATSQTISILRSSTTAFTLVAATSADAEAIEYYNEGTGAITGTLTPSTWAGRFTWNLGVLQATPQLRFGWGGTGNSAGFLSITLGTTTWSFGTAGFTPFGTGSGRWGWNVGGSNPISSAGTYTGNFRRFG